MVEIVQLPPEEWRAYRELRLRALAEDPQAFGESHASAAALPCARWMRWLSDAAAGESWLLFARRGERLVGLVVAAPRGADSAAPARPPDAPRGAAIYSVYVAAEERGSGTGTRLMEAVLSLLSGTGRFNRVSLTVNAAQHAAVGLYRRCGFTVVGEVQAVMGDGEEQRELVMEMRLR